MTWKLDTGFGWGAQPPGSPWVQLWDKDFTAIASGGDVDYGVAAGAKTIDGDSALLINSGAWLAADPGGLYAGGAAGEGLILASDAVSAPIADYNGTLGPAVSWTLSDIIPADLWGATAAAVMSKYSQVYALFIVDASDSDANDQAIAVGLTAVTPGFIPGGMGLVGYEAAAAAVGWDRQGGTYSIDWNTPALVGVPGGALPTAVAVGAANAGTEVLFGVANGLAYPSAWYGTKRSLVTAQGATPSARGPVVQHNSELIFGVVDSATTGVTVNLKRCTLFGLHTDYRTPTGPLTAVDT